MFGNWESSQKDFPYFSEHIKNNGNEYVKYPKGKLLFKTKTSEGKISYPFAPAFGIKN